MLLTIQTSSQTELSARFFDIKNHPLVSKINPSPVRVTGVVLDKNSNFLESPPFSEDIENIIYEDFFYITGNKYTFTKGTIFTTDITIDFPDNLTLSLTPPAFTLEEYKNRRKLKCNVYPNFDSVIDKIKDTPPSSYPEEETISLLLENSSPGDFLHLWEDNLLFRHTSSHTLQRIIILS